RVHRAAAAIWPNLLVVLVPLLWLGLVGAALTGRQPLFGAALWTILLLAMLPSVDAALWRQTRMDAHMDRPARAAGMRVARLGLVVLAFLGLAAAWRVDLWGFASDSIGAGAANALMQILVTLFVGYGVWQVVSIWADRTIAAEDRRRAEEMGEEGFEMGEAGGVGHSRLRTLLPLLKRAAQIALGVMVVMISLSAMGVDTGPLLAGTGMVVLAIVFGSQALVRDVVSGFFFLIEDAFRLGEYIDMGEAKGRVEEISVRSLKLRHHRRALNTVPFHTDLNKVRKLLKQTGRKMLEVEEIKDDFIQPVKSQGAVDADDHGFIMQTKFMSKPGRQWTIRRYAFQALQEAFEGKGIPWARPQIR
ncbi:MAG: mechanosensitive ion channel, partial [Xanthomonadales bacterium]|nr:mechanosensitive ion channel [Xanthomonadales bacterium]